MGHGYTILNQSVNVLTEYGLPKHAARPSIAKRQRSQESVACSCL